MQQNRSRFPIVHATRIPSTTSTTPAATRANNDAGCTQQGSAAAAAAAAVAEDANDLLYQALLQKKQLEQQRVNTILRDARVITDAMVQKQRDAQQSKLVVSAVGDQYVSNARYVQINGGSDPKIRVFPGMHAITPDECDVYSNLVERSNSGTVTVMHNHCMSEQGMIEGFRFTISPREISSILPIPRKMFFRHSVVECLPAASSSGAAQNSPQVPPADFFSCVRVVSSYALEEQVDPTILSLLFKQNEVRDRLVKIMKRLYSESVGKEADFDCMPENVDSISDSFHAASEFAGAQKATSLMGSYNARRMADCRDWKPEMPELLGLYHAYVKASTPPCCISQTLYSA